MVIYWEELHVCCTRLSLGILEELKKSPGLIKLVKMKLNRNMSDDATAKISFIAAVVMLIGGVFLFIFGAVQGAA